MYEPRLVPILARYASAITPSLVDALGGAGGFSGSQLWRLTTPAGEFCLRRHPAEAEEKHLRWVHRAVLHAAENGFPLLPLPYPARSGETLLLHENRLWELTRWLPGTADYRLAPSSVKLQAAFEALGRCHLALAGFEPRPAAPSPGLARRREQLAELLAGEVAELRAAVNAMDRRAAQIASPSVFVRFLDALSAAGPQLLRELNYGCSLAVPLQACLRDIWHEHVLFEVERVTGLLDTGAMRVETVAGDIARLMGSMCEDVPEDRRAALAAYRRIRPLSENEEALIPLFDRSGLLLGACNWISWLLIERRTFPVAAVQARLDYFTRRLSAGTGN